MEARTSTPRSHLIQRLSGYWKMELTSAVLMPVAIVTTGLLLGAQPGLLTVLGVPANVVLLVVGGLYWRAKLHRILGRPETLRQLLPMLDRVQPLSQALSVLAVVSAALGWVVPTLSRGLGDRVMATIFAALAVAEYVNYYHRQLQHFDHRPDLHRLLSGRGFRRSQLAEDLTRWRRRVEVTTAHRPHR